jgi:hypothetical protein
MKPQTAGQIIHAASNMAGLIGQQPSGAIADILGLQGPSERRLAAATLGFVLLALPNFLDIFHRLRLETARPGAMELARMPKGPIS